MIIYSTYTFSIIYNTIHHFFFFIIYNSIITILITWSSLSLISILFIFIHSEVCLTSPNSYFPLYKFRFFQTLLKAFNFTFLLYFQILSSTINCFTFITYLYLHYSIHIIFSFYFHLHVLIYFASFSFAWSLYYYIFFTHLFFYSFSHHLSFSYLKLS